MGPICANTAATSANAAAANATGAFTGTSFRRDALTGSPGSGASA
jgi:hypothetical protein